MRLLKLVDLTERVDQCCQIHAVDTQRDISRFQGLRGTLVTFLVEGTHGVQQCQPLFFKLHTHGKGTGPLDDLPLLPQQIEAYFFLSLVRSINARLACDQGNDVVTQSHQPRRVRRCVARRFIETGTELRIR